MGIKILSSGFIQTGSGSEAFTSMPEEPAVAYSGSGLVDVLIILTSINDIQAKIEHGFKWMTRISQIN